MQFAQIFEGEFSRGYRGRLRVLNQCSSVLKFMENLRQEIHSGNTSGIPDSATLALAAGLPLEEFVQKFSLLPFHRAVSLKDADVKHGDPAKLNLIERCGTRVWRQHMALSCPQCIKEDLDVAFAYWRVTHQIPGIPWCTHHGCELENSSIGKKAMDSMPNEGKKTTLYSEKEFQSLKENAAIQRYVDIALAFQQSKLPMSLIHASYRIAERAKKHDLRVGERGKKATLTERVMELVPICWLKTLYPEIEDWSSGDYFNSIDNSTKGLVSSTGYVLALASLFDSYQEALAYWYGDIEGLPTERKAQRSFGKDYWNSDTMFRLYVEHRGNHTSMGQALGIDPTYAGIELSSAGLPALGRNGVSAAAKAVLAFQAGMSLEAACESTGASKVEVAKLIRVGVSRLSAAISEMSQPNLRKRKARKSAS